MQQIAVRGVNLDHAEASRQRPFGRRFKCCNGRLNGRFIQGDGNRIAFVEWYRTGAYYRPAADFRRFEAGAALPRRLAASLAPGMSELNRRNCALRVNKPSNARQRLYMLVAPDAHVAGRNS